MRTLGRAFWCFVLLAAIMALAFLLSCTSTAVPSLRYTNSVDPENWSRNAGAFSIGVELWPTPPPPVRPVRVTVPEIIEAPALVEGSKPGAETKPAAPAGGIQASGDGWDVKLSATVVASVLGLLAAAFGGRHIYRRRKGVPEESE